MYREASNLAPDRPEPYALSLKLAAKTQNPDDVVWAACGALQNVCPSTATSCIVRPKTCSAVPLPPCRRPTNWSSSPS